MEANLAGAKDRVRVKMQSANASPKAIAQYIGEPEAVEGEGGDENKILLEKIGVVERYIAKNPNRPEAVVRLENLKAQLK